MGTRRRKGPSQGARLGLRLIGAALLVVTGAVHLDLYLTGYRTIPTIGPLFLLQVIAAFVLALVVAASGSRLAAAAGGLFALATLGGYLLAMWIGLFGFKEVRTVAGITAGVVEVAAFAVLAAFALTPGARHELGGRFSPAAWPGRLAPAGPRAGWAVTGASVLALVLLGVVATTGGGQAVAASRGSTVLKTARIGGVTVLTNARGFALYWFGPDTASSSACYGTCAAYWPPVPGPARAGPGVTGTLGTITRTGGALQETYDGHPLYTYVGDTAPGEAHGNNIDLNGGVWHEVTVSGSS
jgi:predicted lipoprotein with Yx(FWY)xxD motif